MNHVKLLIERYPALSVCENKVAEAVKSIVEMHYEGGSLLICGNGGSAADSEHISGELLKGFLLKRPLTEKESEGITADVAKKLQGGIKAIPLTSLSALGTAFSNDVDDLRYAYDTIFSGEVKAR